MNDIEIFAITENTYSSFLKDESRLEGFAETISFPSSENDVKTIFDVMKTKNTPITVQGSKSGIVGGAVPFGGHILNLSKMTKIHPIDYIDENTATITVEAGVTLEDLKKHILSETKKSPFQWPPQPTEQTATIGGILASGSNGINGYYYGPVSQYVEKIKLITLDKGLIEVKRNTEFVTIDNKKTDLLDVLIGSEGIFGIIIEATLRLVKDVQAKWGVCFLLKSDIDALQFAQKVSEIETTELGIENNEAFVAAIEYIDDKAIDIVQKRKAHLTSIKHIADIDNTFKAMIYIELFGDSEDFVETIAAAIIELAEEYGCADDTWVFAGDNEIEKIRTYRHVIAESVNLLIDENKQSEKSIHKLSIDMAIVSMPLVDLYTLYTTDVNEAGLDYCVFGHCYKGKLHINILPKNKAELNKAYSLIEKWLSLATKDGNSLIDEHGIGKIKKDLYAKYVSCEVLEDIFKLKSQFDSKLLLNQGNITDFPQGQV